MPADRRAAAGAHRIPGGELPGRLAAAGAGSCGRRCWTSTASPGPPTTSPTARDLPTPEKLRRLDALEAALLAADPAEPVARAVALARPRARHRRRARPAAADGLPPGRGQAALRATGTSCSPTAAARPTRSDASCCGCTASLPRADGASRRAVHGAADPQPPPGPRARPRRSSTGSTCPCLARCARAASGRSSRRSAAPSVGRRSTRPWTRSTSCWRRPRRCPRRCAAAAWPCRPRPRSPAPALLSRRLRAARPDRRRASGCGRATSRGAVALTPLRCVAAPPARCPDLR